MKKIWCLFSVDNDYNQPDNCLVGWWVEKPSMEKLAETIGVTFPGTDENILNIVGVHTGTCKRIGDTDYWLEQINEGKVSAKK